MCFVFCSVKVMFAHTNPKNGDAAPLVAEDVYNVIMEVSEPRGGGKRLDSPGG